ncbi:MAG: sigma-70 family RNA polymerase sigma factor [Myxococcaceae bacterium]|nr:sigma-70 family RNA polymerase sigma factor [Myxococcaceae bacterium]
MPPVRSDVLSARRADFLRLLERRVGDRALAEDLFQEALVRVMDRGVELRDEEALVGWFVRVLENAARDHFRRTAAAGRALDRVAAEANPVVEVDPAPARTCRCVARAARELKPEYAEALWRIEVDGLPVKDFAAEAGLSASNAGVRVFRAREALRKKVMETCGFCAKNGCVDCTCAHER